MCCTVVRGFRLRWGGEDVYIISVPARAGWSMVRHDRNATETFSPQYSFRAVGWRYCGGGIIRTW